jgi:MFS family permease
LRTQSGGLYGPARHLMKQQRTQSNALQTANGRAGPAKDLNELDSTKRSDSAEHANKWAVLAIVAVGVFMATLDSSIVNISLPTIAHYFGVPLNGAVEWVTIAYLVVVAATLLTIGRLADMIGHKPVWVAGLIIFTLGSAICGAASSLGMLIAARAFQGLGGALLMSISPVMLINAFPARERGRALGLNAVVVALGVSAGPTLGGIITDHLTWRCAAGGRARRPDIGALIRPGMGLVLSAPHS